MPKDKKGKQITWEEFFSRCKDGIKQVVTQPTPLEKVSIELRATFITLIGLIICLLTLIIFRDKFLVSWFAYGLILIFAGNILTTGLKYFGLREQRKFLKGLEINSQRKEDESDTPNETLLETRSKAGEDNKLGDMPVDVDNHADENVLLIDGKEKGMGDTGMKVEKFLDNKENTKGGENGHK